MLSEWNVLHFLITDLLLKWVVVPGILFSFQIERHPMCASPVPTLRLRVLARGAP